MRYKHMICFSRFFSLSHKLEEDHTGAGAVIEIKKHNLLPCSKIKRPIGKRNIKRCSDE